jgi:DNA-binding transcriptional MocR family regulator
MSSNEEAERVSVRTYVPAYQRDEWDAHADQLDMSRSEYLRSMVQAGRRGFLDEKAGGGEQTMNGQSTTDDSAQEGDLESQVVDALAGADYLSWDELLAAVTDDIEDRLETTLQELQATDQIRYSGPKGGYTLDE